jgi:hypothetical protein
MNSDRPDEKELLIEVRTDDGHIYRIYTDSTLEGFGDGNPIVMNAHYLLMEREIAQASLAKGTSGAPVLDKMERTQDFRGASQGTPP